jgi:hypothetical protein
LGTPTFSVTATSAPSSFSTMSAERWPSALYPWSVGLPGSRKATLKLSEAESPDAEPPESPEPPPQAVIVSSTIAAPAIRRELFRRMIQTLTSASGRRRRS